MDMCLEVCNVKNSALRVYFNVLLYHAFVCQTNKGCSNAGCLSTDTDKDKDSGGNPVINGRGNGMQLLE